MAPPFGLKYTEQVASNDDAIAAKGASVIREQAIVFINLLMFCPSKGTCYNVAWLKVVLHLFTHHLYGILSCGKSLLNIPRGPAECLRAPLFLRKDDENNNKQAS